ncbi:hydroxymethylglutaryl-CoA lyase [bacterium]|nr:hydroxymethylglutaryl-CoA lyase [bacterium]
MIRIFEVGPRDGLQNESRVLTTDQKLELIQKLLHAGLDQIEVGAFVRPDRVPQMAGTDEIYKSKRMAQWRSDYPAVKFWSLVPNEKGLIRAEESGARNIAVFGGATETFVQKNIGMSIDESLQVFSGVVKRAIQNNFGVRGYISVCWVCPYEGVVNSDAVLRVLQPMLDMGIQEISLGDTVGRAHPEKTESLLSRVLKVAPLEKLAVHFHDTYGMAITNIDRSIKMGIQTVDSSIGGLGGCPYAAGATGNVATEDVYTLLEGYGMAKLDVEKLLAAGAYAQSLLGKTLPSKRLAVFLKSSET